MINHSQSKVNILFYSNLFNIFIALKIRTILGGSAARSFHTESNYIYNDRYLHCSKKCGGPSLESSGWSFAHDYPFSNVYIPNPTSPNVVNYF